MGGTRVVLGHWGSTKVVLELAIEAVLRCMEDLCVMGCPGSARFG